MKKSFMFLLALTILFISVFGINVSAKNISNTSIMGTDGKRLLAITKEDKLWYFDRYTKKTGVTDDEVSFIYEGYIKKDGTFWNDYFGTGLHKVFDDVKGAYYCPAYEYDYVVLKNDDSLWYAHVDKDYESGEKAIDGSVKMLSKIADNVADVCATTDIAYVGKSGELWISDKGDNNGSTDKKFEKFADNVANATLIYNGGIMLKKDGTLWAWGNLSRFYTDSSTHKAETTPIKIMDNVIAYCATMDVLAAVTKDGTLWSLGVNMRTSYINDGRIDNPVAIDTDVVDVSISSISPLMYVKSDGSLYGIGDSNSFGGRRGAQSGDEMVKIKLADGIKTSGIVLEKSTDKADVAPDTFSGTAKALPSKAGVIINGQDVKLESYNINGFNYYKLRDLAYSLNGTDKAFSVEWKDDKMFFDATKAYESTGEEMQASESTESKEAKQSGIKIEFNNGKENHEFVISVYNIDGYNYFMLRDVANIRDFGVSYDQSKNEISVDTSKAYVFSN